jgi:hypothetical protein
MMSVSCPRSLELRRPGTIAPEQHTPFSAWVTVRSGIGSVRSIQSLCAHRHRDFTRHDTGFCLSERNRLPDRKVAPPSPVH